MSGDQLAVRTRTSEGQCVLQVSGSLFLGDVPSLLHTLSNALCAAAAHRVVVCDVSGLAMPTQPSMLTVFPAALRRSGGWPHCALHLAAPGADLAAGLHAQRMHRYLSIHPSLTQALAAAESDAVARLWQLSLPPVPASVRQARQALEGLWPSRLRGGRDEASLVLGELVANAVQHVGEPFAVTVARGPARLIVAVTDPSPQEPIVRPKAAHVPGRGMRVVAGLTQEWGVRLVHPRAKTVWAALPAPPSPIPTRRRVNCPVQAP